MNAPAQSPAIALLPTLAQAFDKRNNFGLNFDSELSFAKQLLLKNDYALSTAEKQPESLKAAFLNVASIGVSLNPALAHAYLVPRSPGPKQPQQICLDLSYLGMVKIATDTGAITQASAVLVYASDDFVWHGPMAVPTHTSDVRNPNRINIKRPEEGLDGGYCIARLPCGGVVCDWMPVDEILKVKGTSKAKNGPWQQWFGEMAKKTILKRARKGWPQTNGRARLDEAVAILNEHEGMVMDHEQQPAPAEVAQPARPAIPAYTDDQVQENLGKWQQVVAAGQSPARIIAMIESKYTLSDEQKNTILGLRAVA